MEGKIESLPKILKFPDINISKLNHIITGKNISEYL